MVEFLKSYVFGTYNEYVSLIGLIFGVSIFLVYLVGIHQYRLKVLNFSKSGNVIGDYAIELFNTFYNKFKSISISYLLIPVGWLFQAFMYSEILSIFLIFQNWYYLIFVCFPFFIMTLNPTINRGNVYFIPHMIGACFAIISAILGLGIIYEFWIFIIIALILGVVLFLFFRKKYNFTYIIEVTYLSYFILIAGILHFSGLL